MMKQILTVASGAVLGSVFTLMVWTSVESSSNQEVQSITQPTSSEVKQVVLNDRPQATYEDLTIAAKEVVDEVVHVKVVQKGNEIVQVDPFEYFFHGNTQGRKYKMPDKAGSGSGVILRQDGYIVTNNHVIDGADEVEVVLSNNESYAAKVVGADPSTDLALLKIEANNLNAIRIGNSDDLQLGQWVLAVGNPFNLNSTVTAGIVSAKARSINILHNNGGNPAIESFIQTDAAVNPGNSGGALVNAKGELVGINAAIKSPTGAYSGYSFAIPVNIMKKVVADMMEYGIVQRAFIGVSIQNVTAELAQEKDLDVVSGVFVSGAIKGGAADKAGIEEGDVITQVNTTPVESVAELQETIGLFSPGDEVQVKVNRHGKEKIFSMVLRNKEGEVGLIKPKSALMKSLGITVKEPQKEVLENLKITHGVEISTVGPGVFKLAGIAPGFVITEIDHQPVKKVSDVEKYLTGKEGGVLIGGYTQNGRKKFFGISM